MMLNPGDYVFVLDEELSGTIKSIKGSMVIIETDEGFLLEFEKHELVKKEGEETIKTKWISNSDLEAVISEKEQPKRKQQTQKKTKERFAPAMEVDLHIHQLVKSTRGMTNHDMLTLQLDTARRKLEFAITNRIQKIVFIHGVGEGVLKLELEYLFGRYSNIKYYDANYQKYGLGATEVYIYQSASNN